MSKLTGFFTRLRRAFSRRRFESEMAEEMRHHIEAETERRIATGEDPATARCLAAAEFGSVDARTEEVRDNRLGAWLEHLWRDLKFATRRLRQTPGFTLIAIATIAIGIGASTAMFSLVNSILLRSLPVPNPQQLKLVHWEAPSEGVRMRSFNGSGYSRDDRQVRDSVNHPIFIQLREQAKPMADLFGFYPIGSVTALTATSAIPDIGWMVSENFFAALEIKPFIGAGFESGDFTGSEHRVMISYDIWRRYFSSDPAVVGSIVTMKGEPHTIAGVLPPDFQGISPGEVPSFYVSMTPGSPFAYVPFDQDWHWFIRMMARIKPGVSDAQLGKSLTPTYSRLAESNMVDSQIVITSGADGHGEDRDNYQAPLTLMLGVTVLVILVACANLAGLSLARGAAQQHALAVRAALGASKGRLFSQSLTESAILAVIGGSLGVGLGFAIRHTIAALIFGSTENLAYDLSLDLPVIGFCLLAVTFTTLLAGLLPAMQASRADPVSGLKAQSSRGTARLKLGRSLVIAQISISLTLLTGAALGLKSLLTLNQIDPGFRTENQLLFELKPGDAGYSGNEIIAFYDQVKAAVNALPGVEGITLTQMSLLSNRRNIGNFEIVGGDTPIATNENLNTSRKIVGEDFFSTLHLPILIGRSFTSADEEGAPKAAIINETFAKRFLGQRRPIGTTIQFWGEEWEIVGVSRDAKILGIKRGDEPFIFVPYRQRFYRDRYIKSAGSMHFIVSTGLAPTALQSSIRRALKEIDPLVPPTAFSTQTNMIHRNMGDERLIAGLGGALAGVALLLSCIGLYGLISYDVTRRTRETAIRMAIGAQMSDVTRPIIKLALSLCGIGIALGIPLVFGVTQVVKSQLFGIESIDPLGLFSVVITLITVAILAAWIPARRAGRTNPLESLRAE